jgi:hypothetical protein
MPLSMPAARDESKVPQIFPGIFCPGRDPSENSLNPHLRCGCRAVEGIHGGVTLGGVDLAIGEKSESETHGKRV